MGEILALFLVIIGGFAAVLFSALAWRLKNDVFFYLGILFTASILIYCVINYEYLYFLMFENVVLFAIHVAFLAFPIYFLILAKTEKHATAFDGSEASGKVTQAYLDEVINAPDEEIDYEEDLDLR